MLSRVDDVRVFESSDDVIVKVSNRHFRRHQRHESIWKQYGYNRGRDKLVEDENLHPQHPFRMQSRVLQQERDTFYPNRDCMPLSPKKTMSHRPIELVFLNSGEIRAREECPPELALPELPQELDGSKNEARGCHSEGYSSDEEQSNSSPQSATRKQVKKGSRPQNRRQAGARQQLEQSASPPVSISNGSSVSESMHTASITNDAKKTTSRKVYKARRHQNRGFTSPPRHYQATRDRSRLVTTREDSRNNHDVREKLNVDTKEFEKIEKPRKNHNETASSDSETIRRDPSIIRDAFEHHSRRERAPLKQSNYDMHHSDSSHDESPCRSKQSQKMKVSHLDSSTLALKGKKERVVSNAVQDMKETNEKILELQNDNEQELAKSTQLRKEKNTFQPYNEHAAYETEASRENQATTTQTHQADRIQALEEQVARLQTRVSQLKQEKNQLEAALRQPQTLRTTSLTDQGFESKEMSELRTHLDAKTLVIHEFLACVELWKDSSMKEMQRCQDQKDLPAALEHVWLNFPKLSNKIAAPQADTVVTLKTRLRQKEDELRQTFVKYTELKELCAQQCIREAALQNFVYEHRLRGNLVIRKNPDVIPVKTESCHPRVHGDEHQKTLSNRGTNNSACYNKTFSRLANQDDSGDSKEDEKRELSVRTPESVNQAGLKEGYESVAKTVVAQQNRSKRNSQMKSQSQIERIRLVSPPSLSQRHEKGHTLKGTKGSKKNTLQHNQPSSSVSRHRTTMLGQCPPGCGSRLSFMGKTSTKRPMVATASRGNGGVIRPWI
ncbi:hypothetical protein CCR75_001666 [Bremia lactucae]|uniref:Uncharacterized protein n=1 Tax=Bremia lactucae TaxID=4779 RepID=A0A976FNM1_BRELC|nr:hypothetical protein CCR75_001666 [Bremia lactucae]